MNFMNHIFIQIFKIILTNLISFQIITNITQIIQFHLNESHKSHKSFKYSNFIPNNHKYYTNNSNFISMNHIFIQIHYKQSLSFISHLKSNFLSIVF